MIQKPKYFSKYFLILIIALTIINSAHAMVCSSLDGDQTKQGCFEIKTQVYNSTTPIINVTFQESVDVISYRLYKIGELGATYPQNPFEEDFLQQLESGNSYDSIPIEQISSYMYMPSVHIPNGVYLFKIQAFNIPNINIDVAVIFKINGSNMNFWVSNPLNDLVSFDEHPNFAFTNDTTFDLELETERDVEECRFTPFTIPSTTPLAEAYETLTTYAFNTTGTRSAAIYDFDIRNYYPYPDYNGDIRTMAVICKEPSNRYAFNNIYVGIDTTPPVIGASASPSPVVDMISRKTNVTITTSDRAACTIQKINPPSSALTNNWPIITRNPGYDFSLFNEFVNTYSESFNFSANPNPNLYNYNISCTNLANLKSSYAFSIPVDLKVFQTFVFYSPSEGFINSTSSIFLNGSASIGTGAFCTYSLNGTAPYVRLKLETGEFTTGADGGRQIFTATIPRQSDGVHTIYVNCTYMVAPSTITYTIDTTAPTAPNITTNNETCSMESINVRALSFDNVSGVDKYFYNLTFSGDKDYSEAGVSSSGRMDIALDEDNVIIGGTYTLKIRAIDNAGNMGILSVKSIRATNSTAITCDLDKPTIIVTPVKNDSTNTWKITVNCRDEGTGCKPTFYYGTQTNSSRSCNETTSAQLQSTITLTSSARFCAKVFDYNNNFDTYSNLFTINYPLTCANGYKDAGETGIDCGGNCSKCALNVSCKINDDCSSGYCLNLKCATPSCTDKVKNGNETGVDCGGNCATSCSDNTTECTSNSQCAGGTCISGKCYPLTCTDKIKNGLETGVDCGGICPKCAYNVTCKVNNDCIGGYCLNGKCAFVNCTDKILNGFETGVDCGGNCTRCAVNTSCKLNSDCATNYCLNGKCTASSCTDKIKNGFESGVDCGGSCAKCAINDTCDSNSDCSSGYCKTGKCAVSNCTDKVKNGNETGVDCGGNCPAKCSNLTNVTCSSNAGCPGGVCINGKCSPLTCDDNIKNGNEADVDCGGSCPECDIGSKCYGNGDCVSLNCNGGFCIAASCTNIKKDGIETDVDCGGNCKNCTRGQKCIAANDCTTGYCDSLTKTCNINPALDTDSDGLPDVWEDKNCGSATGCDPKQDLDEDKYTNKEEYDAGTDPTNALDYPDYKKYSTISIIFLILGVLLIIAGVVMKVLNVMEEEKNRKISEQKEMMGTLSQIPKMTSLGQAPLERELTEEEKIKGRQARLKALKERDLERKKLINQFGGEGDTISSKPEQDAIEKAKEDNKAKAFEQKQPLKPEQKKSNGTEEDEYVVLSADAVKKEPEDPFTKLKKIAASKTQAKDSNASKDIDAKNKDAKDSKDAIKDAKGPKDSKETKKTAPEKPKVVKYYSKSKPIGKSSKDDEVFEKLKRLSKSKKK
jgi:hypothetical protein